jgi:hypothetical protein
MKKIMTAVLMLASINVFAQATPTGDINLTPTSLKLKVYKFAVSTDPLCTNLITVIDNGDNPQEVEFIGSVNLGSGTLANGTYPCVVIEMSDNIKYTPGSNSYSGNCRTGQEETLDVCRSHEDDSATTSRLIDGTVSTCTLETAGPTSDRVAMYMSTYSSVSSEDAFNPPTGLNSSGGFRLANPLVISGSAVAKFIVNPTGKMCDNGLDDEGLCDGPGVNTQTCQLMPPVFNFSQVN